jgi:hypothetical protein
MWLALKPDQTRLYDTLKILSVKCRFRYFFHKRKLHEFNSGFPHFSQRQQHELSCRTHSSSQIVHSTFPLHSHEFTEGPQTAYFNWNLEHKIHTMYKNSVDNGMLVIAKRVGDHQEQQWICFVIRRQRYGSIFYWNLARLLRKVSIGIAKVTSHVLPYIKIKSWSLKQIMPWYFET